MDEDEAKGCEINFVLQGLSIHCGMPLIGVRRSILEFPAQLSDSAIGVERHRRYWYALVRPGIVLSLRFNGADEVTLGRLSPINSSTPFAKRIAPQKEETRVPSGLRRPFFTR